ncbi:MAG: hypothetical protein ACOYKZ_02825 [Chlamydiia bacterium]
MTSASTPPLGPTSQYRLEIMNLEGSAGPYSITLSHRQDGQSEVVFSEVSNSARTFKRRYTDCSFNMSTDSNGNAHVYKLASRLNTSFEFVSSRSVKFNHVHILGDCNVRADEISNENAKLRAAKISMTASRILNGGGVISAAEETTLAVGNYLDNRDGVIRGTQATTVAVQHRGHEGVSWRERLERQGISDEQLLLGSIDNGGGEISSKGSLDVDTSGIIGNIGGAMECLGDVHIHTSSVMGLGQGSLITAGGFLDLSSQGNLAVRNGTTIVAVGGGRLRSAEGWVRTTEGIIRAGDSLTITSQERLTLDGEVTAVGPIVLESLADGLTVDLRGKITSSRGGVSLRAQQGANLFGDVSGEDYVFIESMSDTVVLSKGKMTTKGKVDLRGPNGVWGLEEAVVIGREIEVGSKGQFYNQASVAVDEEILIKAHHVTEEGTLRGGRITYHLGHEPNCHLQALLSHGVHNPYLKDPSAQVTPEQVEASRQAAQNAQRRAAEARRESEVNPTSENLKAAEVAQQEAVDLTQESLEAVANHSHSRADELSQQAAQAEAEVEEARHRADPPEIIAAAEERAREANRLKDEAIRQAFHARAEVNDFSNDHFDPTVADKKAATALELKEGGLFIRGGHVAAKEVTVHSLGEVSVSDEGSIRSPGAVEIHARGRCFASSKGVISGKSVILHSEHGSGVVSGAGKVEAKDHLKVDVVGHLYLSDASLEVENGEVEFHVRGDDGKVIIEENGRIVSQKGLITCDVPHFYSLRLGTVYGHCGIRFSERFAELQVLDGSSFGSLHSIAFPPCVFSNEQGTVWSGDSLEFAENIDLSQGSLVAENTLAIHVGGNYDLQSIPDSGLDCRLLSIRSAKKVYALSKRTFPYLLELNGEEYVGAAPIDYDKFVVLNFTKQILLTKSLGASRYACRKMREFNNAPKGTLYASPRVLHAPFRSSPNSITVRPSGILDLTNSWSKAWLGDCWRDLTGSYALSFRLADDFQGDETEAEGMVGEIRAKEGMRLCTPHLDIFHGKIVSSGPTTLDFETLVFGDTAYSQRSGRQEGQGTSSGSGHPLSESMAEFATPEERDYFRDLPYHLAPCIHYPEIPEQPPYWSHLAGYAGTWVQPTEASQRNLISVRGPLNIPMGKSLTMNGGSLVVEGSSVLNLSERVTHFAGQMLFLGDTEINTPELVASFAQTSRGPRPATLNVMGGQLRLNGINQGFCWSSYISASKGVFVNGERISSEMDRSAISFRTWPSSEGLSPSWLGPTDFWGPQPVKSPGPWWTVDGHEGVGEAFSCDRRVECPASQLSSAAGIVLRTGEMMLVNTNVHAPEVWLDAVRKVASVLLPDQAREIVRPPERAPLLDYIDPHHPLFRISSEGEYVLEPLLPFQYGHDLPPRTVIGSPDGSIRPVLSPVEELMALLNFIQTHYNTSYIPGEDENLLHALRQNAIDQEPGRPSIVYEEGSYRGERGLVPILEMACRIFDAHPRTPGAILADRILHILAPEAAIGSHIRASVLHTLARTVHIFSTIQLPEDLGQPRSDAAHIPHTVVEIGHLICEDLEEFRISGAAVRVQEVVDGSLANANVIIEATSSKKPDPANGGERVSMVPGLLYQESEAPIAVNRLTVEGSNVIGEGPLHITARESMTVREQAVPYVVCDLYEDGGWFGTDVHHREESHQVLPSSIQSVSGTVRLAAPTIEMTGTLLSAKGNVELAAPAIDLAAVTYQNTSFTETSSFNLISYSETERTERTPQMVPMQIRAHGGYEVEGGGEGVYRESGVQVTAGNASHFTGFQEIHSQAVRVESSVEESGFTVGFGGSVDVPFYSRARSLIHARDAQDILAEATHAVVETLDTIQGAPLVQLGLQFGVSSYDRSTQRHEEVPTQYSVGGDLVRHAGRIQELEGGFSATSRHGNIVLSAGEKLKASPAVTLTQSHGSDAGIALSSVLPFQSLSLGVHVSDSESTEQRVHAGKLEAQEGSVELRAPDMDLSIQAEAKEIHVEARNAHLYTQQQTSSGHSSGFRLSVAPSSFDVGSSQLEESRAWTDDPIRWKADKIQIRADRLIEEGVRLDAAEIVRDVRLASSVKLEDTHDRSGYRVSLPYRPGSVVPVFPEIEVYSGERRLRLALPFGALGSKSVGERKPLEEKSIPASSPKENADSIQPAEGPRRVETIRRLFADRPRRSVRSSVRDTRTVANRGEVVREQRVRSSSEPKSRMAATDLVDRGGSHEARPVAISKPTSVRRSSDDASAEMTYVDIGRRFLNEVGQRRNRAEDEAKVLGYNIERAKAFSRDISEYTQLWKQAWKDAEPDQRNRLLGAAALRTVGASLEAIGLVTDSLGVLNIEELRQNPYTHAMGRVIKHTTKKIWRHIPEHIREAIHEGINDFVLKIQKSTHLPVALAQRTLVDAANVALLSIPIKLSAMRIGSVAGLTSGAKRQVMAKTAESSMGSLARRVSLDELAHGVVYHETSPSCFFDIVKRQMIEPKSNGLAHVATVPVHHYGHDFVLGLRNIEALPVHTIEQMQAGHRIGLGDHIPVTGDTLAFVAVRDSLLDKPIVVQTIQKAVGNEVPIVSLTQVEKYSRKHAIVLGQPLWDEGFSLAEGSGLSSHRTTYAEDLAYKTTALLMAKGMSVEQDGLNAQAHSHSFHPRLYSGGVTAGIKEIEKEINTLAGHISQSPMFIIEDDADRLKAAWHRCQHLCAMESSCQVRANFIRRFSEDKPGYHLVRDHMGSEVFQQMRPDRPESDVTGQSTGTSVGSPWVSNAELKAQTPSGSGGVLYHATCKGNARGILKSGEIRVTHESDLEGAFASTLPDGMFGKVALVLDRSALYHSNRVLHQRCDFDEQGLAFIEQRPYCWRGMGDPIPITPETLVGVAVDFDDTTPAERAQMQCEFSSAAGREITLLNFKTEWETALLRTSTYGISLPKVWERSPTLGDTIREVAGSAGRAVRDALGSSFS